MGSTNLSARKLVLFAVLQLLSEQSSALEASRPVLLSRTTDGGPAHFFCVNPKVFASGRFVSFSSYSLLLPGEPGIGEALLFDLDGNTLTGLSLTSSQDWAECGGTDPGTCSSTAVDITRTGQLAALASSAPLTPDLPPHPIDYGTPNVFLRNVGAGVTSRIVPDPVGQLGAYVAQDASIDRTEVLFDTSIRYDGGQDQNGQTSDLYVRNWSTARVELISTSSNGDQGDRSSGPSSFSSDGRFVVFNSSAANLTSDNPNHYSNLFIRDRLLRTTRRLTFALGGGDFDANPIFQGPLRITADDHFVVFSAYAAKLTEDDLAFEGGVYELDLDSLVVQKLPHSSDGTAINDSTGGGTISADGKLLAFWSFASNIPGAVDGAGAVYVQDLETHETKNLSASLGPLSSAGYAPPNVVMSEDGRTVAFDWFQFDSETPPLPYAQQVYAVRLDQPSATNPVNVPTMSLLWRLLCIAILVTAGTAGVPTRRCVRPALKIGRRRN